MSRKFLIRGALSLSLIVFLLLQMDLTMLARKSMRVDFGFFALAVVFMMAQIFFLNLRWRALMNAGGRNNLSFQTCMLMNIAGYFANVFFIASVGGIVAKSILAVRHGVGLMQAVFATFLDRFMTLVALVIFSALGLPFLAGIIDTKIMVLLSASIGLIVLSAGILIGLLRSGILKNYILSSRRRSKIIAMMRFFLEDYPMMIRITWHSLAAQACFFAGVIVLSLGVDSPHTETVSFLALLPILALIASLPISFGGWGIREGAFIYGLGLIGFAMEDSFFLSIQVGLASLVAPFIIGLPYLLQDDFKEFLSGKNVKKAALHDG
jgi:glycosyltransferase 2 family protein